MQWGIRILYLYLGIIYLLEQLVIESLIVGTMNDCEQNFSWNEIASVFTVSEK